MTSQNNKMNIDNLSIKQREQLGITYYQGQECVNEGEQSYLDLLRKILNEGQRKEGRNGTTISSFSSTDRSNISLARSKFNESLNADLSMQRLEMTIKGDPFWVEYYVTEKTKEKM